LRKSFFRYAWLVGRNLVGWILIVAAVPVSGLVPIPLGTPLFLIGFTFISFPGKRRLTSRLLRGRTIKLLSGAVLLRITVVSLLVPPVLVWVLAKEKHQIIKPSELPLARLCAVYAAAIAATWIATLGFLWVVNLIIHLLPAMRRRVRPWMRRHGMKLLPPRKKGRTSASPAARQSQEILQINVPKPVRKMWDSLGE
jgi:hypothetical protein